jgi:hypothetical protein
MQNIKLIFHIFITYFAIVRFFAVFPSINMQIFQSKLISQNNKQTTNN